MTRASKVPDKLACASGEESEDETAVRRASRLTKTIHDDNISPQPRAPLHTARRTHLEKSGAQVLHFRVRTNVLQHQWKYATFQRMHQRKYISGNISVEICGGRARWTRATSLLRRGKMTRVDFHQAGVMMNRRVRWLVVRTSASLTQMASGTSEARCFAA